MFDAGYVENVDPQQSLAQGSKTRWEAIRGNASNSDASVMEKQVSSLNTLWLVQCIRTHHPAIDINQIVQKTFEKGPFFIENLQDGCKEKVDLIHMEGTDYWFSNIFMMALYCTIEECIDDPHFAYKCGASFYKTQPVLKTAVGVPLIGPYRLLKKIVSENDRYNRTKRAEILSLAKGHVVIRLTHKPRVIMQDFGMKWHLGVFESYARLAGVTDVRGSVSCIEKGPRKYGDTGRAIYDFEFTFKDPGFLRRICYLALYAIPTVKELIESAELIQAKHDEQILNRDRIIKKRTDHLVTIQKKLMEAERSHVERKLETLSAELITTEERERKSIAEDLHDSVTQLLALSVSNLKGYNRNHPGQQTLLDVQGYIETALDDTRSLTFQISPPVLYDFGLEAALQWLAEDISGRNNIEMDCINLLDTPLVLNDYQKVTLYRAVRETMINCIKHSQADYACVTLHQENGTVAIETEDNGKGFIPGQIKSGFGLASLEDRLEGIGAHIDIVSTPGKGTLITLFPFSR